MKVIQDNNRALIGGIDATPTNIGISDNAEDQLMILNVLTNTLYSDKVGACEREYGCNGMDANVEAGRGDQPIEVSLPNRLNQEFSVRDFGFGMSEEQILNVFCKLGRSTKRGSNAFTGMLGIGSKAGFAYGDLFTVTSWTNGHKASYQCYRDAGGLRLLKLGEVPSDAPDGIQVTVPVRTADIETFRIRAASVYRYFKVRPIIHGAKIDFAESKVAELSGTDWRYIGDGESSVAIMGNVGYTIDPSAMTALTSKQQTLLRLGLELDFQIGDLEIAATREGLQYREHTVKKIAAKLDQIIAEISKAYTDKIANAKSYWEACCAFTEITTKRGGNVYGYNIKTVIDTAVKWNGQNLDRCFDLENKEKLGVSVVVASKANYRTTIHKYVNPFDTVASKRTQLIINDLPAKCYSPTRVRGFLDNNKDFDAVIVFTFTDGNSQDKYWKARKLTDAPTIDLSSITPLSTANGGTAGPSAHKAKHSANVFVLGSQIKQAPNSYGNPIRGRAKSLWWDRTTTDLKGGSGVYVVLDCFNADNVHPFTLCEMRTQLKNLGVPLASKPIYGFKPESAKKVGAGWKSLKQALLDEFTAMVSPKLQAVSDYNAAHVHTPVVKLHATNIKLLPDNSLLRKYLAEYERMLTGAGKATMELARCTVGNGIPRGYTWWPPIGSFTLPKPTTSLEVELKSVLANYPMLNYTQHEIKVQDLVDYVSLVGV